MKLNGFIAILILSRNVSICANKEEEVWCFFWKSCIVPCRFTPGNETTILWTRRELDVTVALHSTVEHYNQMNSWDYVHPDYVERTDLFDEEFSSGNASLLINMVLIRDEGQYLCLANNQMTYTNVKVFAPVTKVFVTLEDNELICRANRVYPRPEVKWTPEPQTDPLTSIELSDQGWFSVFSAFPLPLLPSYQYSCNVSTAHSWKSESYTTHRDPDESLWFWLPPLILGLILCTGCAVILLVMRRRISKCAETSLTNKEDSGEPSAAEVVKGSNPEEEHLKPEPEETEQRQRLRSH